VRNETVATCRCCPSTSLDWIDAGLKGAHAGGGGREFTICGSLPHGHVAAVTAMGTSWAFPRCWARRADPDLASALIVSRVLRRRRSCPRWPGGRHHPGGRSRVTGAFTDEVYAAMDWLAGRQEGIEKQLAARHLDPS